MVAGANTAALLFNALNAIAALSDVNLNRMRLLLDEFGSYLRASFNFQNSELLVPLGQELALVRSYLYIENERFEGRLNTVWEVEANMELRIPRFPFNRLSKTQCGTAS